MENILARFSTNVYLLSILIMKELIELFYTLFSDLTLRDLYSYKNISTTISLILLFMIFKNIFKTEKRIDDNYLNNKFNDIRAIRKHIPNFDNLPMYIQDLNSEMIFIFNQMLNDKKINKIISNEDLKMFIRNKYLSYYKIKNSNAVIDQLRPMNNPL